MLSRNSSNSNVLFLFGTWKRRLLDLIHSFWARQSPRKAATNQHHPLIRCHSSPKPPLSPPPSRSLRPTLMRHSTGWPPVPLHPQKKPCSGGPRWSRRSRGTANCTWSGVGCSPWNARAPPHKAWNGVGCCGGKCWWSVKASVGWQRGESTVGGVWGVSVRWQWGGVVWGDSGGVWGVSVGLTVGWGTFSAHFLYFFGVFFCWKLTFFSRFHVISLNLEQFFFSLWVYDIFFLDFALRYFSQILPTFFSHFFLRLSKLIPLELECQCCALTFSCASKFLLCGHFCTHTAFSQLPLMHCLCSTGKGKISFDNQFHESAAFPSASGFNLLSLDHGPWTMTKGMGGGD